MPDQNPLDTLISNPSQEPIEAPKSASSNPLDSLVSGGSSVSAPVSTPSSNPLEAAFGISNPNNGQTEAPASPKFDYQDPNKPWYSRAFSWLNTPLTESLFGLPEDRPGAGGFERGVEHIASGLTSPLSVALTAATFGTGGLVESAGVTALKEAGLTAAEIADATKASQAALDATRALKPIEPAIQDALTAGGHDLGLLQRAREATGPLNLDTQFGEPALQKVLEKAGFSDEERAALTKASDTIIDARQGFKPVEAAVKEAGVDPALWKRAQSALYDQGLTEHDLLGGNMVERGAFQILHHTVPDLPIAVTARAAKTANALLNAGFTLQQFETASAMSPRFLDALKEGDYDKAWEYGTEAFAGGALGVLGASHALHSAGELFKPLIEPDKAMRPSDEYLAIQRANQEREAMHAVAEQHAINLSAEAKRILGHEEPRAIFGDSKEVKAQKDLELASVLNHVVVGGDAEKAATWSDVLAEAAGRNEEPAIARPNNGQTANPDVQKLAQDYTASAGIDKAPHEGLVSVDPEAAKRVADAYDLMKHNPDDPKVKASYDALIKETKDQWDAARAAGYTLEPWDKPGQPYANSKEMADDVRNNKHLYYFQGGEVPEGHPLGQVDPETGETYNNIFRAVHDLFGHAKNGYEFGPRGEENAFLSHSKMYSDEAIPAMLSETKAQNSWVNFGKHFRDEKGNVPIRGEKGYVPQTQRPYAEQKAGILPPEIVNPHLSKEPQVGTPVETPSRAGTQVVHSNDAGEVRVGADGRPVVWLSPEAWEAYNRIAHPGNKISGVSYSPDEAADISKKLLKANEPGDAQKVLDLFWKAQDVSKQSLLTAAEIGTDVTVAAEELQHTHQRELAQDGEIRNLFKSQQWSKLSDIIPTTWTADMDRLGYDKDPITRVAETAAQFRSGKAAGIVPDTDITRFLDSYYSELEANYGKEALESADRINEIAAQHVKDIYENRRTRQTATEGGVANQATGNRQLSGLETGRETGAPEVGPREPQTGLTSTASNRPDIRRVFHWSRQPEDFEETNPSLEGTGVRGSGTSRPYIPGTYFGEPGYQEPAVQGNAKKFYADLDYNRVYNAENDPLGLAEKAEAASKKSGKGFGYEYEKLIQDSGYEGYRNQGVIKYFKPVKVARDFSGLGLAARGSVSWDQLKPYLGDDVTKHDTEEKQAALTAAFNTLPDSQDYREAIKAGRAGQMWYERSSRAFDALLDSGFDFIKPKDKTKFLNFVAALSPVQPVRQNLLMALNLWSKWDKAGRPTDVEWKNGVPNKNASLWRILKGRGQTQGVDLPARMNNAIRALQGEPLSGPKVSAFTTNLGKDVNRVTNDTWMAVFGDQDPNRINKPAIYDAMSAKVREAANATGIAPRQAQAAIWSFIKSLAELSGWGNDRWIPPQEIIKQGLLTPELVGMHSADFADMLQNDPEIREAIKKIGGNLDALDTKLKTYVPGKPAEGEAAVANPQLLNAAQRLEAARSNSRIAAHLARKQGPSLFDTEFRPNTGLFAKGSELQQQIDSNVFKNQPKEYQDLVLESLRRVASGSLSDRELAAAKFLRDEQDRNFEIGSSNDLLHSYIDDYMTRVYKDTNPEGKVISSQAKGGKFATNVSMAKQRVYDSNLTALLKSPKQMLLDPVDITARGRAMLIKAAANRQLIDTLRDRFTRASDGRPAVVLSGQGQVVSGANGEDPKTFIDPNRVRKINIDPKVVDQLTKSGDLQRFLDDGTIRDITPYVRPNNIGAAIEKLEEQAQRKEAQYDAVGNNKLRTDLMYLKSMQNNNDFSGLKAFNDAQEKQYAWDPQDYISLANGAMKGWNFVTNDSAGNGVYVRSDIKVHPEFAEYLQNRLGLAQSDIAKHPIGKALLGAGTKLKQTLLSLSPFHMVQEALRGIMVGVNPFHISGPDILTGEKVDPSDPNSPTIIRKAVEYGFTTGTDYSALQAHSEGLSSGGGGLLSKIPGVGKVISNSLDWYQNFLFKRYIPALKARSVELMFHEYQRLHPEWSVDRAAKAAALHTNDTFGGINWQAMGRSATTQDWGRLMLLAPDWLESEMRSGARLFNKDDGGLGRAQVAKMALGLWGVARVLNLVTTGKPHLEAPFGLTVKNKEGKETVFSIRTLPTDLLHAAADPVGFIQGRLSPVVRSGTELASGRDQFGRKLQPSDLWADVFRNMAPIPLQSLGQAVSDTGPQIGNIGQGWKSVGGTAQTYQTPAQKIAADLASTHSEDGPIDTSQMSRHHRVIQLEDQVRAGELSWPDLYKLTYQTDQLKESELKKIQENVKATHGMDAGMASLFSRASRLPAKEYLDLLDATNASERAALVPLTIKVQKRYLTKAKKEETPEERAKDPVFQRLLRMIPGSTQNFQPQPQSSVIPQIPAPIQKEVAYLYSATHPETGHRVGSNDGKTWYDHQTGAPVNG